MAVGLVSGLIVGAAISEAAASSRESEDPERPYYYYSNGYFGPPPVVARSTRDRVEVDVELPPFDPHAARAALNEIDVSSCRASGAPTGFGHAKATFNPDGRISKVVVDEPAGMADEAAKCIGDRIGTAMVPAFKGSLITVGTTFHVK